MSILLENRVKRVEIAEADRVVLLEDENTRITFWRFPPGAQTGWPIKIGGPNWQHKTY